MSRRNVPGFLAVGLLLALIIAAGLIPVPYVTVRPGPTINVLGKAGGKPIVDVEGHRTFPTKGQLRLVTVSITNPEHQVSLGEALGAWANRDDAVVPRAVMYPPTSTNAQEEAQSSAEMVSSQDSAIAAALRSLGYRLPTYAEITGVTAGGPSDGTLKPRDRIVRLNGSRITKVDQVFEALSDVTPGDIVH